ncbi:type VI immunity family protein [Archangium primigenium]|uniref:type VI immunity family protein n=1 Tax=[Archangium] primigenium TaxID=2792470 RepID=UPI0030842183
MHREVIRLVLHLPFDHQDLASAVGHALDVYLEAVGSTQEVFSEYFLGYEPNTLTSEDWPRIRSMLAPPRGPRFLDDLEDEEVRPYLKEQFERRVDLLGGAQGLSGYGFFYGSRLPWRTPEPDAMSLVSFSWPTEFLEAHGAEASRALMERLASLLPYASGHAGLAFYSPNVWGLEEAAIHEEALRHPGLDVTHGERHLGVRVDGVHWLNFLGPEVLGRVGGPEALRARLHAPGTTVQALDGGRALVALGPVPEAGDIARGDTLPAYRELARVLEPWLLPCPETRVWHGCPPGTARRWGRRFLD